MEIIQRLIPTKFATRTGVKINPTYITIHETDNENKGANAEAHAKLQENGNSREASWHYQIDDKQVIQSIPDNEEGWHAGNKTGNLSSIAIEICVNQDGDFKKAVTNASELTKQLMSKWKIPVSNVVQHNKWSGKNCPSHLRSGDKGIKWDDFISLLDESTYKVIIPNLQFWQAKSLVNEYTSKGYTSYGTNLSTTQINKPPEDKTPYSLTIVCTHSEAINLVIELKIKGYDKTYGSKVKE